MTREIPKPADIDWGQWHAMTTLDKLRAAYSDWRPAPSAPPCASCWQQPAGPGGLCADCAD